ncbi:hypothetical protein BB561_005214 [Smittium simulii]|uniref:Dihydrolipoamide acetyltransferase component of pyruvate dehydrogenase complex n=1 Tax=Smittium simulii TaxID=133385 RepID=A0A2T9YBK0_9FUNG|nr:hypothetical protein BB561_005214 [Smittium simulii]
MFKRLSVLPPRFNYSFSAISASKNTVVLSLFKRSFFASANSHKLVPYNLADIGEGITECEIIQWYVKVGDRLSQFDKVCEVQSDKATVEITSRFDGVIKELIYNENDIAPVGKPLLMIEIEDKNDAKEDLEVSSTKELSSDLNTQKSDNLSEASNTDRVSTKTCPNDSNNISQTSIANHEYYNKDVHSTPAVRFLAKDNNVDLRYVSPTGKSNRVTKEDVLNYINKSSNPSDSIEPDINLYKNYHISVNPSSASETIQNLSPVQKAMFNSMSASLSIPHFSFSDDIDVDSLINMRNELNLHLKKQVPIEKNDITKITFLPFFIKATSMSLLKYPILNARLSFPNDKESNNSSSPATQLVYHNYHNIGTAMDTPSGLLVPNIKNVESKSILQIAQELSDLQQLARNGQLTVDHMKGGTFTLSSVGNIGGTNLSPVIVSNQLCIGAFGKIKRVPTFKATTDPKTGVKSENVVASNILVSNWCADHRVVDGATLARFATLFKSYLESPAMMIANMK